MGFLIRQPGPEEPAKPPIPPRTSGRRVVRTSGLIRPMKRSAASISTPAFL